MFAGDGRPTMFVAVAGRSNGLGPTVSGNTTYPVINCPPLSADWAAQDIWSSLRLPSGSSNNSTSTICFSIQTCINNKLYRFIRIKLTTFVC